MFCHTESLGPAIPCSMRDSSTNLAMGCGRKRLSRLQCITFVKRGWRQHVQVTFARAPARLTCSMRTVLPRGPPPTSPGVTSTAQARDCGSTDLPALVTEAIRARRLSLEASPVTFSRAWGEGGGAKGVIVCGCVCVFLFSVDRANRLTNENTPVVASKNKTQRVF